MDTFSESEVVLEVYGLDKREDVSQNINFNLFISDEHISLNKLCEGDFDLKLNLSIEEDILLHYKLEHLYLLLPFFLLFLTIRI